MSSSTAETVPHHFGPTEPDTPGASSEGPVSWPRNPEFSACGGERHGESDDDETNATARTADCLRVVRKVLPAVTYRSAAQVVLRYVPTPGMGAAARRSVRTQRGRGVVDRKIEVEKRVTVVERVNVPIAPRRGDWPDVLAELVKQIDSGRVYDRDLRDLAQALDHVLRALASRPCWQRLMT